ncbi:hypothetical protein [Streptomyces sp. C10-9-1]|uniref:hypothetical protein n=1 Tax=Streptomyces sp. C10-9-1 TaxID=1859285 RepID=UPI003F49BE45
MAKYPTILAGMTATAALLDAMLPNVAAKTATESVTSSTTMQDDDELFVHVAANATYIVDMLLIHASATAADIRVGWTVPAGASFNWAGQGATNTTSTSSFVVPDTNMAGRIASETLVFGGGASSATRADLSGTLITAGTAGTLQFQWAQNASDATATQVRLGSWLSVRRVA